MNHRGAAVKFGVVKRFPKSWRTSVMVRRSGGRDRRGNPQPEQAVEVHDCLIAADTSSEGDGFDDSVQSRATLYRDPDPGFKFQPTDRIVVPEGQRMAGAWQVSGEPAEWPLGVAVPLKRP